MTPTRFPFGLIVLRNVACGFAVLFAALGSGDARAASTVFDCENGAIRVAFNEDGNVIRFESPSGHEHIGPGALTEGYVLSYNDGLGTKVIYDLGEPDASHAFGWSEPAFVPGSNFTARVSLDGRIQLFQTFSVDCQNRLITILSRITNTCEPPACTRIRALTDFCFARHVDFNVDSAGSKAWAQSNNNHAASVFSYIAWNDKGDADTAGSPFDAHMVSLSDNRSSPRGQAKVTAEGPLSTCPAEEFAIDDPVRNRDLGGRIEYTLSVVGPGLRRTSIVTYGRN